MAMQVLWDLRKTFRCAVLTGSTSDITKVAMEVVQLFTAGSQNHQRTVLLLLNNESILEDLEVSIMRIVAEQKIVTHMPLVIFLSCVRNNAPQQSDHVVLKNTLSDNEKKNFDKKKEELQKRYKDKCEQFHGFNIMQSNFSQDYVREACAALENSKKTNQSLKLAAFLCLLNAYVPGSYLLESQCLDFLRQDKYDDLSLEDQMQPLNHLIITFQQNESCEKKVRMAHTMIAECCTKLLAKTGVTRSDTTRNFLNSFCRYEIPLWLLGFVKDMLTKRKMKKEEDQVNSTEMKQEKFSRLILDIHTMEGKEQCATVLKVASNTFGQNPFFPQALARFYYIELKDYNQAEMWAQRAIERDPQNSFVADTLGQVHKNRLMKQNVSAKTREILQMAQKAIKAFEDEERLAEDEDGPDMKEHGKRNVSRLFNSRGLFGYLQVCNTLYDKLFSQNETWEKVLTKKVSATSFLKSLRGYKLLGFIELLESLRDKVERKCMFLEQYLTYSKPNTEKDDPEYISEDTSECYQKYVGDTTAKQLIQMFQEGNLDEQSVEALSFLVKQYTQSELEYISTKCREMCPSADSETALVNNILTLFRRKMPPSDTDPPELHMFTLLLYWPENEGQCVYDISQIIQQMQNTYENAYKKYFRARYLLPVFFIGKGEGVKRIVHRTIIENHLKAKPDWSDNWKKEEIFRSPDVQELLLRLDGVVRDYGVYTGVGGKETKINANLQNSCWKKRQVTFYLGFTIRGPVAFGIQNKTADTVIADQNGKTLTNSVKETKAAP
ncbi:sterile alpha motif domain-containing protein 9-like [Pundamilia nyererei]|uniref:Sterile alpha motif domain-containing protein 9-like n=2 Tax=Haplochromini TaxID=319058 RepID=A0A9Y3RXM7_9CICH|nr:PREDICTED: sterile alpha motif domain-containing protein 9-like [Pundamilia nyererei]